MAKKQTKKKTPSKAKQIINRRARHDYTLDDTWLVGLVLTGAEVRNLRTGHGNLTGAYVNVINDELWLINGTINSSTSAPIKDTEQTRTRKLLAKKSEIKKLIEAKGQGNTIVPIEILTTGRFVKIRIAVGKGKRQYDKRQVLKKRAVKRDTERALSRR